MKIYNKLKALAVPGTALLASCLALALPSAAQAQNTLTNGLVAYYPFDIVTNGVTPDLASGYDMILSANMRATNFIPSTRTGIGTQSSVSASNMVSFSAAQQAFLYYFAVPGDKLPINLSSNYTMNWWVNFVGNNQTDLRIFAEDDLNGNANPLWVIGTGGGGGAPADNNLHWLRRQQGISINGLTQGPDAIGTQNDSFTSLNPVDGTWHMVTITKQIVPDTVTSATRMAGSNCANFEVYVDTVRDPGSIATATQVDAFGQQAVLIPEVYTNQNHPPVVWTWLINATSFGGLSRTLAGGNFVTGLLDDASFWNRTLSSAEITTLYQFGITNVTTHVTTSIPVFTLDNHEVLYGDQTTLRWSVAHATKIVISPGIGDVTSITTNGSGSINLVGTATTTYTMTASHTNSADAIATATLTVSREAVANNNWHLLERFDSLPLNGDVVGAGGGILAPNWINILGDFSGPLDYLFTARTTNNNPAVTISNNVMGTASEQNGTTIRGALSGYFLNSLTIQTNSSNTLFFRMYTQDANTDIDDFSMFVGLSDAQKGFLAVSVMDAGDKGPAVNITRSTFGTGGIIDMFANSGITNGGYQFTNASGSTGNFVAQYSAQNPNGLTAGVVYDFWMDVNCQAFGSQVITNIGGGVTNRTTNLNSGTFYSVYIKPLGAANRTLVFSNFLSDRFPFAGAPAQLSELFIVLDAAAQNPNLQAADTNSIIIDDFYLSRNGYNSSIPVAPGVYPDLTVPTSIPGLGVSSSGVLSWTSIAGATYSVYKASSLGGAPFQLLKTELPSGGATTTFTDPTYGAGAGGLYKVSSP